MNSRFLASAAIAGLGPLLSCSEDEVVQPAPEPLPQPAPRYLLQWGWEGSGLGQFRDPWDAAVDTTDTVFVVDNGNHRVQVFDSGRNFVRKWSVTLPGAIAVDLGRDVCVVTRWHLVTKYDAYGDNILTFGGEDDGSHEPGKFNVVGGVATDSSGNVYATDSDNHRIQTFNGNGGYMLMWGSRGSDDGQFVGSTGIAVDRNRDVLVVDHHNHRVQKFNSFGRFFTRWGARDNGNGQFVLPRAVAVDTAGNIFVVDTGNHRIQKFR